MWPRNDGELHGTLCRTGRVVEADIDLRGERPQELITTRPRSFTAVFDGDRQRWDDLCDHDTDIEN
jgi:hypothetical protein